MDVGTIDASSLQGGVNVESVTVAAIAEESHGLLALGTSLGTVELSDPRSRSRAATLHPFPGGQAVTAADFHQSGLELALGSSDGLVKLFDLRSPHPILRKDQGFGFPIHTIQYLTPSSESRSQCGERNKIMSADKRILKIWDTTDGAPWTSVETAVDLNSVAWYKDSGMFFTANEGPEQHTFFIPELGPAPYWARYMDNMVEEMAEETDKGHAIYVDYKFLTQQQLTKLALDGLIGKTNLLRPYMHGYFVNQKLYEDARLVHNPDLFEEERRKRIETKLQRARETRIRGKQAPQFKVNKRLAEKILRKDATRTERKPLGGNAKDTRDLQGLQSSSLLLDPRFASVFADEDFAIDETSHEFRLLNPSTTTESSGGELRMHTSSSKARRSDLEFSARIKKGRRKSAVEPTKQSLIQGAMSMAFTPVAAQKEQIVQKR